MKIKIIGQGCRFFTKLYNLVDKTLVEKSIYEDVTHVTELKQIIRHMPLTPVLIINGEVTHRGKFLPSKEIFSSILQEKAQ